MTEGFRPAVVPFGLDAARVDLPPGADRAAVLAALLRVPGVLDAVVAETTAAFWFDPRGPTPDVATALTRPGPPVVGTAHTLPTRYDGPDLAAVAAHAGVSVAEVVARHAARAYTVLFLGFVPGFAYLGEVDPVIALPRRASPRPVVAAGAVALAGPHTGVYPGGTPGGWNLLGHTDAAALWSAPGVPRLAIGDAVRFVPR